MKVQSFKDGAFNRQGESNGQVKKKKKKALVYGKISNGSDDKNVGNL